MLFSPSIGTATCLCFLRNFVCAFSQPHIHLIDAASWAYHGCESLEFNLAASVAVVYGIDSRESIIPLIPPISAELKPWGVVPLGLYRPEWQSVDQ